MKLRTRALVLALAGALLSLPALPASAADPASITLTTDKSSYTYGQTVKFVATIHAVNLYYVLQVQYPGSTQWRQLEYAGNVNDDVIDTKVAAYYNMKIRGLLIDAHGSDDTGDDTVEAIVTRAVPVRSSVATIPSGFYSKSGKYAVMSKYSAKFVSQSAPAFPGERCLRHQVQRKFKSGWKTVKTGACVVEGKQGRVKWKWKGTHPSKVKYRVRAKVAEDKVNKAGTGAWVYFKFS